MQGKLYGIGIGPGDEELLTLKAIRIIEESDYIAVPKTGANDRVALEIAQKYIKEKPILECAFSMEKDEEKRKETRRKAVDLIEKVLAEGKTVGFITLGDPTVYSTFMYVHGAIKKMGYETEIIPGITSFTAAAAALDMSLCEGKESLHIIPASSNEDIETLIGLKGNKVIMKSGKSLTQVFDILDKKGLGDNTKIVERCTMKGQRVFHSIDEFKNSEDAGYFTIAVVKE